VSGLHITALWAVCVDRPGLQYNYPADHNVNHHCSGNLWSHTLYKI